MKNKLTLAISSLFCLATFAVAQETPAAAPAPAEAAPAVEASAPAPAAEPAAEPAVEQAPVQEPAPVSAPEPTATSQPQDTTPVVFYYANTVQAPPPSNQDVQPAPAPAPAPLPAPKPAPLFPKQTVHYGIQGSIGSAEYIGTSNDDLDEGIAWNAGLFATIPISAYFFNLELGGQFIYRKVSSSYTQYNASGIKEARKDKITAYSFGVPIQMNVNVVKSGLVGFFFGLEMEVPLYNNLQISINGDRRVNVDLANVTEDSEDHCAPISWDFILGMYVNATKNFGIYARLNTGFSDIYDDLYIRDEMKDEYWGFTAMDFAIGLKFFI